MAAELETERGLAAEAERGLRQLWEGGAAAELRRSCRREGDVAGELRRPQQADAQG